jgi:acyl-CoA reductase-like NAD-dependent aldehyde dehydrogenase
MRRELRNLETRRADVRRLVAAASRLVDKRAALIPSIVESTGLSPAGVDLALHRHLEVNPSDADLDRLIERAGDTPIAFVILSANVFVGALRAIALAKAAAADVIVRPSRRDPAFARALVEEAADPAIVVDPSFEVHQATKGEIHVYGADETIREVRAHAAPGVRVRAHGSGMGIVWLSSRASPEAAARAVAEDVVIFDQRGCLSPRMLLVEGAVERANAFADLLHAELERLDLSIPRGDVPADERAAADRYVATMTYACRALVGTGHAIGIAPPGAPLVLAPAYRNVHIAACTTREDARKLLAPISESIVAIGSDDEEAARSLAPAWARRSKLGQMQRPPLDGPVDLRDGF